MSKIIFTLLIAQACIASFAYAGCDDDQPNINNYVVVTSNKYRPMLTVIGILNGSYKLSDEKWYNRNQISLLYNDQRKVVLKATRPDGTHYSDYMIYSSCEPQYFLRNGRWYRPDEVLEFDCPINCTQFGNICMC